MKRTRSALVGSCLAAFALAACGNNAGGEGDANVVPRVADDVGPVINNPPLIVGSPAPPVPEPGDPEAGAAERPVPPPPSEFIPAPQAEPEPPVTQPNPDGRLDLAEAIERAPLLDVRTVDPELLAMIEGADLNSGQRRSWRCASCHSFLVEGDLNIERPGPNLFGVVDRAIGNVGTYDYSPAMAAIGAAGATWTIARLDAYLADWEAALPGTSKSVSAIAEKQDRADLIAFLATLVLEAPADNDVVELDVARRLLGAIAAADPAEGEELAARCAGCHNFGAGQPALIGPNLFDVVGRQVGADQNFNYSAMFRDLNARGSIWSYLRLDAFLENPAVAIPGTRMGFSGISDAGDRAAVIAYLRSLSEDPLPLTVAGPETALPAEPQRLKPLTFTAEQVVAGRDHYRRVECLVCHYGNLAGDVDVRDDGGGAGPALIGPTFQNRWFDGPVFDLFRYVISRKPPDAAGGLPDNVYVEILAYILSENGFPPGGMPLSADEAILREMGFYQ